MDYELTEEFTIDNDNLADWAVRTIKSEEDETNRLIAIAEDQIEELNKKIQELTEKCEKKTKFLKTRLGLYFSTVPHKETKTQESYKLLSGSLVYKKPSQRINHDDDKLIAALDGTGFVETKKFLKWSEYKKNLIISDGEIIDSSTGEIIDGCTVEDVPPSFDIKY